MCVAWCLGCIVPSSCNNDLNNDLTGNDTEVLLSISVSQTRTGSQGNAQTRAEMPSAKDRLPVVKSIWAVFCLNGNVLHSEAQQLDDNHTAIFKNIPSSVNRVYVIGYPTHTQTSPAVTTVYTETELQKQVMIDMQAQNQTDATLVNTYGVKKVDFSDIEAGKSISENIELVPAMARMEIAKIDPANPPVGLVKMPIKQFKLDGIFINNTYTQLALDSLTVPTASGKILNYGSNIGTGSVWLNPSSYPAAYADLFDTSNSQPSFAPKEGTYWGYYVAPLSADKGAVGTTINDDVQSVIPHIVLKLRDIAIESGGQTNVIPGPMYLTVRSFKVAETGEEVKQLRAGYTYRIGNLAFGMEHLAPEPENNPAEIVATLSVLDWIPNLIEGGVE